MEYAKPISSHFSNKFFGISVAHCLNVRSRASAMQYDIKLRSHRVFLGVGTRVRCVFPSLLETSSMHELWYNGILGMQGESQVDLLWYSAE
jgi:hypothetical protein